MDYLILLLIHKMKVCTKLTCSWIKGKERLDTEKGRKHGGHGRESFNAKKKTQGTESTEVVWDRGRFTECRQDTKVGAKRDLVKCCSN
jgi:hypothetical protein